MLSGRHQLNVGREEILFYTPLAVIDVQLHIFGTFHTNKIDEKKNI